jgi:NTP pyrophosphatase (non-canonical NTP hydrolase)
MQTCLRTATREASSLGDLQLYVREMEDERGSATSESSQQCLLLGEEIGELFKAVRKHENMRTGTTSMAGTVDEELADVLIYICAIANVWMSTWRTRCAERSS